MSGFAGDLFIRIRPDFSGFESELKAQGAQASASASAGPASATVAAGLATTTTETKALAGATRDLTIEARAAELGFGDLLGRNRALQASAAQTLETSAAVAAGFETEGVAARSAAANEIQLARARTTSAASASAGGGVGVGRLLGVSVGAIALLTAGTQLVQALGDALAVTGNEAGTTEGRFRNFAAELLHFNIAGAFSQLGKFSHEFSVAEIEAINSSEKLTSELKAMGAGAALAAGQLAALKAATQIPASFQLGVTRSQAQGTPANQLDALRREDQQIGRQIEDAKRLHVSQAELDAALTDLFNQRIANHSAQRVLIAKDAQILAQANTELLGVGQQVTGIIAGLQADIATKQQDIITGIEGGASEGVLDAQLGGSVTAQIEAERVRIAKLEELLKNKKLTVDQRRQIKGELLAANDDIASLTSQIAQNEKTLHAQLAKSEEDRLHAEIDALKAQITSPLDAEITRLENQLNAIRSREQAQSIKDRLAKAKQDLADARQSVQIIGAVTPGQRKDIDAFLQPFRSEVSAAQGAQKEAGIQSRIDALKTREQNLLAPLDRTARAGETQVQLLREIKAALLANQRGAGKTPPKTSRDTPGAAAGATARDLAGLAT